MAATARVWTSPRNERNEAWGKETESGGRGECMGCTSMHYEVAVATSMVSVQGSVAGQCILPGVPRHVRIRSSLELQLALRLRGCPLHARLAAIVCPSTPVSSLAVAVVVAMTRVRCHAPWLARKQTPVPWREPTVARSPSILLSCGSLAKDPPTCNRILISAGMGLPTAAPALGGSRSAPGAPKAIQHSEQGLAPKPRRMMATDW
eukprot:scaffold3142_cov416-Prasinococcus_capsulatus_cf.AAC.6